MHGMKPRWASQFAHREGGIKTHVMGKRWKICGNATFQLGWLEICSQGLEDEPEAWPAVAMDDQFFSVIAVATLSCRPCCNSVQRCKHAAGQFWTATTLMRLGRPCWGKPWKASLAKLVAYQVHICMAVRSFHCLRYQCWYIGFVWTSSSG